MAEPYELQVNDVLKELQTSKNGLSSEEASQRLEKYGKNIIQEEKKPRILQMLGSQFKSPVVWVLLVALVITIAVEEIVDSVVIAVVVIANAVLGVIQEYRSEKAIAMLKKMLSLKAKVFRNGEITEIDAAEVVPGDVLVLDTGDKVAADCRLIETTELKTQEATLTGESFPVLKQVEPARNASVADRASMAFASTVVVNGRGLAVVTATGFSTEVGKIARQIEEAQPEETPLQKRLAKLSIMLAVVTVVIAVIVFLTGLGQGRKVLEVFLQAVALAVAAIPEGLPAVVTIALALGVRHMAAKKALVRKLPSVETLGACTVICTDKTGTLTHNEMTVTKLFVDNETITVSGTGYEPTGSFSKRTEDMELLLAIGALNNNARLTKEGTWKVFGDPTEAALLVSSEKAGLKFSTLQKESPRIHEIPFTSERKRMTTIHHSGKKQVVYMKGAPEVVLGRCEYVLLNGQRRKLTSADKNKILNANETFAGNGLRVIGFAYREIPEQEKDFEKDMIFVGLQAMIDPPRPEVKEAIAICQKAGIRVVMITGDHLLTAQTIAKQLGITGGAVTGEELKKINLDIDVERIGIYARVDPGDKLKIVDAFKKKNHIVAMTGDGVNDAPALKRADIGVAMGITGTDVAKEASAMVLADDNFATIVKAVREGRKIYDNIRKFVEYLLSSNIGEVLTVFVGALLGWPLIVIARQILWINLVTDLFPALALAEEHGEPTIMERPPRKAGESILTPGRWMVILLIGTLMMLGTLYLFDKAVPEQNLAKAQTIAFTTLVLFQVFNVINLRSERHSVFQLRANWYLIGAVVLSVLLQVVVVQVPALAGAFGAVPLSLVEWVWIIGVSASVLVFGEIVKVFVR